MITCWRGWQKSWTESRRTPAIPMPHTGAVQTLGPQVPSLIGRLRPSSSNPYSLTQASLGLPSHSKADSHGPALRLSVTGTQSPHGTPSLFLSSEQTTVCTPHAGSTECPRTMAGGHSVPTPGAAFDPVRNSLQSSQAGGYSRTGLQPPPLALARATQGLETSGVVTPLTSPEHF